MWRDVASLWEIVSAREHCSPSGVGGEHCLLRVRGGFIHVNFWQTSIRSAF